MAGAPESTGDITDWEGPGVDTGVTEWKAIRKSEKLTVDEGGTRERLGERFAEMSVKGKLRYEEGAAILVQALTSQYGAEKCITV